MDSHHKLFLNFISSIRILFATIFLCLRTILSPLKSQLACQLDNPDYKLIRDYTVVALHIGSALAIIYIFTSLGKSLFEREK